MLINMLALTASSNYFTTLICVSNLNAIVQKKGAEKKELGQRFKINSLDHPRIEFRNKSNKTLAVLHPREGLRIQFPKEIKVISTESNNSTFVRSKIQLGDHIDTIDCEKRL